MVPRWNCHMIEWGIATKVAHVLASKGVFLTCRAAGRHAAALFTAARPLPQTGWGAHVGCSKQPALSQPAR